MNDGDLFRLMANPYFLKKEKIERKKIDNNYLQKYVNEKYPKTYLTEELLKDIQLKIDDIIYRNNVKLFTNDFLQSNYQTSIQKTCQKFDNGK
tara:strand:- start:989 stop:1267 length:279 start_codon:yes stop_codon:yes gene_type:complete